MSAVLLYIHTYRVYHPLFPQILDLVEQNVVDYSTADGRTWLDLGLLVCASTRGCVCGTK